MPGARRFPVEEKTRHGNTRLACKSRESVSANGQERTKGTEQGRGMARISLLRQPGTEVYRLVVPISLLVPRGGPTRMRGRDAVNTIEDSSACRVDQPEE